MGRGRTASSPKLNGVGLAKTFILSHCRLIVRRVTEGAAQAAATGTRTI